LLCEQVGAEPIPVKSVAASEAAERAPVRAQVGLSAATIYAVIQLGCGRIQNNRPYLTGWLVLSLIEAAGPIPR
jgi:hypothetical protein